MAERKNLAALIQAPAPTPAAPPVRSDRPASPDKASRKMAPDAPVAPPPSAAVGGMTVRSWYMPKASSDRLAALVDDVHFATRLPKHLIMGALVNVLDRHRDEIEAEARAVAGE